MKKIPWTTVSKVVERIGGVGRAFTIETVDFGSITGWVEPKTIKINIHSFPASAYCP